MHQPIPGGPKRLQFAWMSAYPMGHNTGNKGSNGSRKYDSKSKSTRSGS